MRQAAKLPLSFSIFQVQKDPVKLTALLYLKEALLGEQYEECAEFIEIAKEFGANRIEIQNLLEDPRRTPKF